MMAPLENGESDPSEEMTQGLNEAARESPETDSLL
jgi:hypothetical protein